MASPWLAERAILNVNTLQYKVHYDKLRLSTLSICLGAFGGNVEPGFYCAFGGSDP
jgi:hypothetical protein